MTDIAADIHQQHTRMTAQRRTIVSIGSEIVGFIAILLLTGIALKQCTPPSASPPTPITNTTPTADAVSPSNTHTPANTPTPTFLLDPTSTPTPTRTPTHTPTPAPTSSHTPTPTPAANSDAGTATRSAGIFAAPSVDSTQLSYVAEGDQVDVLGRSAAGSWYYVRNERGIEGFAYSTFFQWPGDFDALPIKNPLEVVTSTPTPASGTSTGNLEMDLWPVDGRCEAGGIWYRTISIAGRGGNGTYTYYWNDEKLAGPMSGTYGFEVHSVGGAIIGKGKVVSGDGQIIERNLYVAPPECNK